MKPAETLLPEAKSMILSYRSFGYTLESAIADIIDNSISANASEVRVATEFLGEDTKIRIMDNGSGMTLEELLNAMKLGCTPETERTRNDLGRFGHGLKTASFSQCKCLTVISKKDNILSTRTWDLDHIANNGWQLIENPIQNDDYLKDKEHGTVIVWEKLDRLVNGLEDNDDDCRKYRNLLTTVSSHLSMTFHIFIEQQLINIYCFSDVPIKPFNPFLPEYRNLVTKVREEEKDRVKIESFVLPDKSYIHTREDFIRASNGKGMVNMQGFFIYRAQRLLLCAGWMGLKYQGLTLKSEQEYNLARIAIYLDNEANSDINWAIDVKKSHAIVPGIYRDWLSKVAFECRKKASETYRYRGAKQETVQAQLCFSPIWKGMTTNNNGKRSCKLNWENEMIVTLLDELEPEKSKKVKTLLRLIEEFLPIESIAIEECKDDNDPLQIACENCSREEREDFFNAIKQIYISRGYNETSAEELTRKIVK